jgi:hypothetical protein
LQTDTVEEAWRNGNGIDLATWADCTGDFRLAVGYAALLWPTFVERGKYLLLGSRTDESIKGFEVQTSFDGRSVEAGLNHRHLGDMHAHDGDQGSADKLLFLVQS